MAVPVFPVVRESTSEDVFDLEALRAAMCAEVREEVRLRGGPRPRLVAWGDGVRYTVDLADLRARDPEASVPLTAAALAARVDVHQVFFVVRVLDADARGHLVCPVAVVLERPEQGPAWTAALSYVVLANGTADPDGDWRVGEGIPPAFQAGLLGVLPGDRPARLAEPRALEPDIRAAFGEIPDHLPLPRDAVQQGELTAAMVVPEVLRDGLEGAIVLRFHGRAWEWWLLGEGLPTDLDEMVRVICQRAPVPDGVALVQLARFDGAGLDGIGVQIVAERAGARAERWVLLELPEGPSGPRRIGKTLARPLPDPGDEGWIGIAPLVDFDLAALSPVGEG